MKDQSRAADAMSASLVATHSVGEDLQAHGWLRVECVDADGRVKWVEEGPNLIVTTGRNKLLDETLGGSAYTAAWYVGLIDNAGFSAIASGDTMASHAGWSESAAYSEGTRPQMSFAAASSGSKASSANVSFSINGTATINGAFLSDNSTKSGSSGVLFAAKSFSAARSVQSGDTLNVGYTASLTAS